MLTTVVLLVERAALALMMVVSSILLLEIVVFTAADRGDVLEARNLQGHRITRPSGGFPQCAFSILAFSSSALGLCQLSQ